MLESFTYLPETISESQSSADSSNSSDSDYSFLKCMHELHMNVPINAIFENDATNVKKK